MESKGSGSLSQRNLELCQCSTVTDPGRDMQLNKLSVLFVAARENVYHETQWGISEKDCQKKLIIKFGFGLGDFGNKPKQWGFTIDGVLSTSICVLKQFLLNSLRNILVLPFLQESLFRNNFTIRYLNKSYLQ